MFIVQVDAGRPTKMRFEDDDSFREKLLQPLGELLGHDQSAWICLRACLGDELRRRKGLSSTHRHAARLDTRAS